MQRIPALNLDTLQVGEILAERSFQALEVSIIKAFHVGDGNQVGASTQRRDDHFLSVLPSPDCCYSISLGDEARRWPMVRLAGSTVYGVKALVEAPVAASRAVELPPANAGVAVSSR
jgi:hypothetical protein